MVSEHCSKSYIFKTNKNICIICVANIAVADGASHLIVGAYPSSPDIIWPKNQSLNSDFQYQHILTNTLLTLNTFVKIYVDEVVKC